MNRKHFCGWLSTPTAGIVKMLLAGQQVLWIATAIAVPLSRRASLPIDLHSHIQGGNVELFVALLTPGAVWR